MTYAAPDHEKQMRKKIDFKFWAVVLLVLSVLGFNISERLLLDADDTDISLARLFVSAKKISNPRPGDVFVFDHQIDDFVESKYCSLQVFERAEPTPGKFTAINIWGSSVNATLMSVQGYVGDKLTSLAKIDHPERQWNYSKTSRTAVHSPMETTCLQYVIAATANPNFTPFVVDSIYLVDGTNGQSKWVRLAKPLMLETNSCDGPCPEPKDLREIIKADKFAILKADWGIVWVE